MAHSDFVYLKGFRELLNGLEKSKPAFLEAVNALYIVFSLSILHRPHHTSLAQALPISVEQQRALRDAHDAAIEDFAKQHLADVIDAYGFTEFEMDSALARADKTPYEALFEEGARRSEMSGNGMSHLWPMLVETRQTWRRLQEDKDGFSKASL